MHLTAGRALFAFALLLATRSVGQFGPGATINSWPNGPELYPADLDGDGDTDLVGLFGTHWKWFENTDGAGDFAPPSTLLDCGQDEPQAPLLGDVDSDLLPDLIWYQEDRVLLARNQGNGTFAEPETVMDIADMEMAIGALALSDITGDGRPDIVITWGDGNVAQLAWCRNVNGTFMAPTVIPVAIDIPTPTTILTGDMDADEGTDVVILHAGGMVSAVYNTNSDASNWVADTLCYATVPPFQRPQVIDVDNDGDLDLAEAGNSAVQWAENKLNEQLPFEPLIVHQLEPFTSAGKGRFGRIGCEGVSVVFVPNDPQLPTQWRSYLPALHGFAPATELVGVPRGQHLRLAQLDADGRDDLLLTNNNGTRWYPSQAVATTTPVELPSFGTLCRTGPAIALPAALPANGQWSGTWVNDGLFHRANAPAGTAVPLTYTAYEEAGCPVGGQTMVPLIEGPTTTPVLGPVLCSGSGPYLMTSVPQNTQWTGLSEGNVLDPAAYTGGIITCSYEDASGIACASFIGPFQVWNTVSTAIQPAGPFCVTDGPQEILPVVNLPNSYWSGDISGTSAVGAWFDPSQGAGTYLVVLQRNASHPQQCGGADTLTIHVSDALPDVTMLPFPEHCSSQPVQLGGASPEGGTWSGPGVVGDLMDPAITGPGNHTVSYTYTAPEGCSSTTLLEVTFVDAATVSWESEDLLFCGTDPIVQFNAQPAGGVWDAPLGSDGSLDPAALQPGTYPVLYTWTDPAGCSVMNPPLDLQVLATTEVSILPVDPLCSDGPAVTLMGSHAGTWSGSVNGEGASIIFDPQVLGPGTWTVTLAATEAGACPGSTSMDIVVSPCLGTGPSDHAGDLRIVPNPFATQALLVGIGAGTVIVDVFDATGRAVRSVRSTGSNTVPLDLSGEANGAYLVRTAASGVVRHIRVLKAE